MSKFFIERPVLANVLAIVLIVIGTVALLRLPISQYPNIVPPTIMVTANYPGASAETVVNTVALPIENQVNGVLYSYLAGNEFKGRVEGIVEAFTSLQDQLQRERRAMEKNWKEREKQIERVIKNTVGLYGDMQGIIGGQIPTIDALELESKALVEAPANED